MSSKIPELCLLALSQDDDAVDRAEQLIWEGESVNACDENGVTPVMIALQTNSAQMVGLLASEGADLNAVSCDGQTTLHRAMKNHRHPEVVQYVADVKDRVGNTALHYAAEFANYDACAALLRIGATISCKNHTGCTPLYLVARKPRRGSVVRVLHEFLQRLAVLEYRDVPMDPEDVYTIVDDDYLRNYYSSCLRELDKAKSTEIYGDISLYDIFTAESRVLSGYSRNDQLVGAFEDVGEDEFPIYCDLLKSKFDEEIQKHRRLLPIASVLDDVFCFNDPFHLVIRLIMSFFRGVDSDGVNFDF